MSVVRDKDDKARKSMHNKEKRFQIARTGFAYCCLVFYCLVLSYNYCFLDLALPLCTTAIVFVYFCWLIFSLSVFSLGALIFLRGTHKLRCQKKE